MGNAKLAICQLSSDWPVVEKCPFGHIVYSSSLLHGTQNMELKSTEGNEGAKDVEEYEVAGIVTEKAIGQWISSGNEPRQNELKVVTLARNLTSSKIQRKHDDQHGGDYKKMPYCRALPISLTPDGPQGKDEASSEATARCRRRIVDRLPVQVLPLFASFAWNPMEAPVCYPWALNLSYWYHKGLSVYVFPTWKAITVVAVSGL
ncbi:hypothetical protein An12g06760 [Aspergillus niger]|uniref:Uncharacterized protein n=2 Tax=Aspergillus niger TaxID=5061 RepID=A2QZZ3_ASPNC|nr:hypothetical protein An12g06760 [Aspergillus niger]CAK41205.1 hypothetical protein An12g06760 [Aspergillus niger]